MNTQTMTQAQAIALFRSLRIGNDLGSDTDGNTVTGETRAGALLDFIGAPWIRCDRDKGWLVADSAAFLRNWADALEKAA